MHFETAGREDVGSDVEFARVGGEEERWVDVWLCDEVAEVGRDDVVSSFVILLCFSLDGSIEVRSDVFFFLVVGIRRLGFPFLKNSLELLLRAEEPDSLSSITHPGLQDPPFPFIGFLTLILLEASLQFPGFDEGIVDELGVIDLEMTGRLDVCRKDRGGVFGYPVVGRSGKVMLPDQSLADYVCICERRGGMRHDVLKWEGFVSSYLEERGCGLRQLRYG